MSRIVLLPESSVDSHKQDALALLLLVKAGFQKGTVASLQKAVDDAR